jgi:hypothetical protein
MKMIEQGSPENFFAVLIVIDTGKSWRQQRQQKGAAQNHCQVLGLPLSEIESFCHKMMVS